MRKIFRENSKWDFFFFWRGFSHLNNRIFSLLNFLINFKINLLIIFIIYDLFIILYITNTLPRLENNSLRRPLLSSRPPPTQSNDVRIPLPAPFGADRRLGRIASPTEEFTWSSQRRRRPRRQILPSLWRPRRLRPLAEGRRGVSSITSPSRSWRRWGATRRYAAWAGTARGRPSPAAGGDRRAHPR